MTFSLATRASANPITFPPCWNVGVCVYVYEFWELPGRFDQNQTHTETHSCNPWAVGAFRREGGLMVVLSAEVGTALGQGLPLWTWELASKQQAFLPAKWTDRPWKEWRREGDRQTGRGKTRGRGFWSHLFPPLALSGSATPLTWPQGMMPGAINTKHTYHTHTQQCKTGWFRLMAQTKTLNVNMTRCKIQANTDTQKKKNI